MNKTLAKRIAKLEAVILTAAELDAVELSPEMFESSYLKKLVADMLANPARYKEDTEPFETDYLKRLQRVIRVTNETIT